jgi:hypothetical protein
MHRKLTDIEHFFGAPCYEFAMMLDMLDGNLRAGH